MGGGGSKEVRVAANPQGSEQVVAQTQSRVALVDTKSSAVEAEERRLYHEGFIAGRKDALNSMRSEIERETKSAYAQQVLEDERARTEAVAAEADKLAKKFPRPPIRPQECVAEEEALLACTPSRSNRGCAQEIASYKQCADKVVFKLMNPAMR